MKGANVCYFTGARKYRAQDDTACDLIPARVFCVLWLGLRNHSSTFRHLQGPINPIRVVGIVPTTPAYAAATRRSLASTADVAILTRTKPRAASLANAGAI